MAAITSRGGAAVKSVRMVLGAVLLAELLAGCMGSLGMQSDGSYLLESAQAHRTVPALLGLLAARGLPLEQLSTHSATLDDVFVHLTGRQLRDA